MLRPSATRLLCLLTLSSATVAILVACTTDNPATPVTDAGADGATPGKDGSTDDDGEAPGDAGKDAAKDAKPPKDANGPGADGDECVFNRDCQAALRCECDETTGCACKAGTRGTGKNGIDACDSGNQCTSSVCVEGPADNEFHCSDECTDESECEAKLPKCLPITFFPVPICAREPPK